ncbi:transmembrane protein 271 [Lampetra planeri]
MARSVRTRWRISLGVAALFSLCAAACLAAGVKGHLLGALVDPGFRLDVTAGGFYSGGLASLAGPALLCCLGTDACRRSRRGRRGREARDPRAAQGHAAGGGAFLLGVTMVTMAVLAAFVGTVLDGEAFSKALGKYEEECTRGGGGGGGGWRRGCGVLHRYTTVLVISASLNGIECLLGFALLIATREYKLAEARRDRDDGYDVGGGDGGNAAADTESGGGSSILAAFPPFGFYVNPAALGGNGRAGPDRDVALPGYAESCRHDGDCASSPYSAPPPAYSDIFPGK